MVKISSAVIPDISVEKCIYMFFISMNANMVILKKNFTNIRKQLNMSYVFSLYFHHLK